jgi:hypothetical protein
MGRSRLRKAASWLGGALFGRSRLVGPGARLGRRRRRRSQAVAAPDSVTGAISGPALPPLPAAADDDWRQRGRELWLAYVRRQAPHLLLSGTLPEHVTPDRPRMPPSAGPALGAPAPPSNTMPRAPVQAVGVAGVRDEAAAQPAPVHSQSRRRIPAAGALVESAQSVAQRAEVPTAPVGEADDVAAFGVAAERSSAVTVGREPSAAMMPRAGQALPPQPHPTIGGELASTWPRLPVPASRDEADIGAAGEAPLHWWIGHAAPPSNAHVRTDDGGVWPEAGWMVWAQADSEASRADDPATVTWDRRWPSLPVDVMDEGRPTPDLPALDRRQRLDLEQRMR